MSQVCSVRVDCVWEGFAGQSILTMGRLVRTMCNVVQVIVHRQRREQKLVNKLRMLVDFLPQLDISVEPPVLRLIIALDHTNANKDCAERVVNLVLLVHLVQIVLLEGV